MRGTFHEPFHEAWRNPEKTTGRGQGDLTYILSTDYIPHTSSHPRARSRALKCGDGRRAAAEMRCQNLRDRSGDTRAGRGGGRAVGSQVRARRPKPQGPDAPAAHHPRTIGGSVVPRNRPPDAAVVPTAVGRHCTRTKKGTAPERSAHRGSCGASLKTPRAGRRGNGGLAVATLRKVAGPGWKLSVGQARFAAGSPWCREVPRSVGPSRPRRPARPRILLGRRARWEGRRTRRLLQKTGPRSVGLEAAMNESEMTRDSSPSPAGQGYCR